MQALEFYRDGLLTITPNTRLRDTVIGISSSALMTKESVTAVGSPNVVSLSDFIEISWKRLQSKNHRVASRNALLSDSTLFFQWVNVIRCDNALETILNPTELANQAMSADKRLALWNIHDFKPESVESESFYKWRKDVLRSMTGIVSSADALRIIIDAIKESELEVPEAVCAFSFDDLPPLHENLFQAISERAEFFHSDFSSPEPATEYQVRNFDNDEQLSNMAKWAYNAHEKDPRAKLAIVVPDLPDRREAILNALNEVFEPQVILPNTPQYTPPYNFTAGTPLSNKPLIKVALNILSYGLEQTSLEEVLKIVKSPFISGSVKERSRRAKFDLHLREKGKTTLSLVDLLGDHACPRKLSYAIGKFANSINNRGEQTSLAQWLTLFDTSLDAIGWPGERNLNSEEFQAFKQFKSLLTELSGNMTFQSDITVEGALFYLQVACNNTLYSAESKETPIQVMGLLEAAGLNFDKMFMLDMNMGTVPSKASPNPFLPVELQIDNKMPHADAQRELDFFESLITRYRHNCSELIYSHCQFQHESELVPSYFVSGAIAPEEWFKQPNVDYKSFLINRIPVHTHYDEPAPLDTSVSAKGGVSILQKQVACPFNSFVDNRLRVRPFPKVRDGISAPVRGQLLHDVMARIWKKLRTQEDLLALSEDHLHLLISEKIDESFLSLRGREDIDKTLIQMEKTHFQLIVSEWLEFEKSRPPFMVDVIEEDRKVKLGGCNTPQAGADNQGLSIKIRVDRVDSMKSENGTFTAKVPLDYKSGSLSMKVSPGAFKDVQLPIAALSEGRDVVGVAYAGIKKHAIRMLGLSDGIDIGKGVTSTSKSREKLPDTFEETLELWGKRLNKLADDYIAGEAHITPSIEACRYCEDQVICRT